MEKLLLIETGVNLEDKIFRVNKKSSLIFKPSPKCLIPQNIKVKTNYPKKGSKFVRSIYTDLTIINDHQDLISSSFNWHVNLKVEIAGTFVFVCYNEDSIIWKANVIVLPELKTPINSIRCQTVLSKNLGPLSTWRQRLSSVKEARYNMIHFTPVQELGSSQSCYSLRDQHKVNPTFEANLNDIKKEVDYMEMKWNILSVTDIVLNHTADDSQWIYQHPDCAFNLSNCPSLRPAFLLDSVFVWFMQEMISGVLTKTDGITTMIEDEETIKRIGILLKTFYIPQLKIYELYMIDVENSIRNFGELLHGPELAIDYSYFRNNARVIVIPSHIQSIDELRKLLKAENLRKRNEIRDYLNYAVENALNAIRYERLNPSGPHYGKPVSSQRPLVAPYFTHTVLEDFHIAEEEILMFQKGSRFMAHNGWVMGETKDYLDPLIYLKRELIAWGDCIKLFYGTGPQDAPYLWEHMRKYVEAQAKIFHGFRIDNCHSTPLHVAEYMIDIARSVRPDIYIMAELFTSSEATDNIFVNRLGLTSLIRESLNAHDCRELGRLMYRFGGTPVGAFFPQGAEPLKPAIANAIFYDQTHDNESPIIKRSAYDLPATMAILNMANCATGSNKGYDELVPHYINVVEETRLYADQVPDDCGLLPLRRFINGPLLRELEGFTEIFIDQVNDDVMAITRSNPLDGRSIVLVARTAFTKDPRPSYIKPIPIEGKVSKLLLEAQAYGDPNEYLRDDIFINGLSSFKIKILNSFSNPGQSRLANIVQIDNIRSELQFHEFLPSSVLAVEVSLTEIQSDALKHLNQWKFDANQFDLTLSDANYILFRCCEEDNFEPYELPNFCRFTYCGLYGLMYYMEKVRENQDQAHPLAVNLRYGNWLSEYIVARLRSRASTSNLAGCLDEILKQVDLLPRGMVPKYFDSIISQVYNSVVELIYSRMSVFVSKGPKFVKLLALSSVALVGECISAPLPVIDGKSDYVPSIAAGLPHFASGYMRNWGRDTFIALRGLLLVTGRFSEAKNIILSCARTLKHGLIPNLIDGGNRSRYNCRDAVWWWLYCIKEYTKMAPNGSEILRCKVKRLHKPERTVASGQARKRSVAQMNGHGNSGDTTIQNLYDLIQEVMECHFKGMEFIEENAGRELDEHMVEKGFKIQYGTKQDTGFIYGGNEWNCGTWMDKMGSSIKANTKGRPSSPRDGSAIELVALSKSVVSWLDEMSKLGLYPYDRVERVYDNTITLEWTWKKWASLIQENFEKYFYIPAQNEQPAVEDPNPELINRRTIYKDTLGASIKWQDYQFRPNFLIACVVAPEMFDKNHIKDAIQLVRTTLCGPLGIKTLDPDDWNYCGDYDNGNDSCDPKVAHGFNYHQGPEWVWLTGYYIRASSKFLGAAERQHHLELLGNIYAALIDSPWLGLPELTNSNGKPCKDSCQTQAWSIGTTLEALHESGRLVT